MPRTYTRRKKKGRPTLANAASIGTMQLSAYGYVYQIGSQSIAVGSPLAFSHNGPLRGITHTAGTSGINVGEDGVYNIAFSVYTQNNNPQDWAVAVNGVNRSRFNSAGQTISGITSLSLRAGDNVTIRNVATLPNPATLRSTDTTTAQVLIYRVD